MVSLESNHVCLDLCLEQAYSSQLFNFILAAAASCAYTEVKDNNDVDEGQVNTCNARYLDGEI